MKMSHSNLTLMCHCSF